MDVSQFLQFTKPDGQKWIAATIAKFRETHGESWREEMKADYPDLSFIADLCAHHTAEDAFEKLKLHYVINYTETFWQGIIIATAFDSYRASLLHTHAVIKTAIEKPLVRENNR